MYKRSNIISGYTKFANQTNDILVKYGLIKPNDIPKLNRMFQLCLVKAYNLDNVTYKTDLYGSPLQYDLKNAKPLNRDTLKMWIKRLDKAIKLFDDIQTEQNDHLEILYKNDIAKSPQDRMYLSLNTFLLLYQNSIYTKKQFVNLLSKFPEVKNSERRATRFKEFHSIKYFSKKEISSIIEILRKAIENGEFCENAKSESGLNSGFQDPKK